MVSGVSKLWDPGIALDASLVILSSSVHDQTFHEDHFRKNGAGPGISSYSQNISFFFKS